MTFGSESWSIFRLGHKGIFNEGHRPECIGDVFQFGVLLFCLGHAGRFQDVATLHGFVHGRVHSIGLNFGFADGFVIIFFLVRWNFHTIAIAFPIAKGGIAKGDRKTIDLVIAKTLAIKQKYRFPVADTSIVEQDRSTHSDSHCEQHR